MPRGSRDSHEVDRLLAEDDWMRRLARRLVPDPALADDLAQDAWVSALDGAHQARSLRPWLGGVLRNLMRSTRRSDDRRQQRERKVARDEALPSAADLVEEVTLRREVADQLLALEEPYRSTLYLRFFRDLSLKRIAKQTDVPVSTVHDRLKRGLQLMRAKLDRAHGGDRRAWALAMLPIAQQSSGLATTAIATIAMSTTFKVAAGVAIAGGALGFWIQNRESQALEAPGLVPAPVPQAAARDQAPATIDAPARPEETRTELAADTPEPLAAEVASAAPELMLVEGVVVDSTRQPIAGVRVGYKQDGADDLLVTVDSGPDGRFAIERPVGDEDGWELADPLWRKVGDGSFSVEDSIYTMLAFGVDANDDLVVVVEPRVDFGGRVVDTEGQPLSDAVVAVQVRRSLSKKLGFSQFFASNLVGEQTRSDEQGQFRLTDSCAGDEVFLGVTLTGYEPAELELPRAGDLNLVVALTRIDDTIDVTGHVVDESGSPVERAQVSMGHTVEFTDSAGAFTLHWSQDEANRSSRFVKREDGVWVKEEIPLHIAALKDGHMPTRLDLEGADLTEPLVLRLGAGPLSISGAVVDEDGRPRAGVIVWVRNLTPFGKHINRQGKNMSSLQLTMEVQLRGGGQARGVVTDASGAFTLTGLLEQDYDVQIYDAATSELGEGWTLPAGSEDVELVLARDPSVERVAGRLISSGGQPISGVMLTAHRNSDAHSFGTHGNPPDHLLQQLMTDEEGRFEFPALATEDTQLMLFGSSIFFRAVPLADFEDLGDMEIVEPVLCELQVELDDPALAELLATEDAEGNELEMVESFGVFVGQSTYAQVEDGLSGILRVPETARTLVLYRKTEDGKEEVARRRLELDPAERTVIRP